MLTRDNIQDIYPLTAFQHGLLFHDLMDQDKAQRAYFQQLLLRMRGELDLAAFEVAWNTVIARHDILRTAFKATGAEQPLQIVLRQRPITLAHLDVSELPHAEREATVLGFIQSERRRGFRLGRDPLLRVACVRLGDNETLVVWSFHHIIGDGWCATILQQELAEAYTQAVAGQVPATGRRPGFGAYVRWLEANPQARATAFWVDYLAGGSVTPVPELTIGTTATDREHQVQRHCCAVELSQQLRELAQRERITLSTLLHTLWGLVLARWHDVDDVVFGMVTTTRPPEVPQAQRIVGPLIATLPLRLRLREGESAAELLRRMQSEMNEWLAHCHAGLGEIRSACGAVAVVDHFVVVENYPKNQASAGEEEEFVPGLMLTEVTPYMPNSYPFSVAIFPDAEIAVEFSFDGHAITAEAVTRLWQRLLQLAHTLVADATMEARRLSVVLPPELTLLRQWGQGAVPLLTAASVAAARQTVVAQYPTQWAVLQCPESPQPPFFKGGLDAAVVKEGLDAAVSKMGAAGEGGETGESGEMVSHAQLQARADAIAEILRQRGIAAGATIAVLLPPGIEFFAALLAGLCHQIAVVPLDPAAPAGRNRHILRDCGAAAVLELDSCQLAVVSCQSAELNHNAPLRTDPTQLTTNPPAYIIYTSGTTGLPKGTRVGAASLLNYVGWLQQGLGVDANERFLLVSSPAFDLAYTGIFGALLLGGSLVIPAVSAWKDAEYLVDLIVDQQITAIKATPSFLQLLLGAANAERLRAASPLRLMILGGEAQSFTHLRRLRALCPQVRLFNHYGPTEATIGCVAGELDAALLAMTEPPQRIGRPIAGAEIALTDRWQLPVAPGALGEILIGGRSPALGYMPSAQAAETRFIRPEAFAGRRFYRSGDFGRWLPDGTLCFVGRRDDEIKIRGYRVDTAEVAAAIQQHSGYPTAVLVTRDDPHHPTLHAFLAVTAAQPFDAQLLRQHLADTLPDYMLPTTWQRVAALPLTANGKLDRDALLALRSQPAAAELPSSPPFSKGSALEETVRTLFAAALGGTAVDLDADFFALGGHSLTAVALVSALRRHTGTSNFTLADLFAQRTVRKVAHLLAQPPRATTLGNVLASGGAARAFFFPPTLGLSLIYRELAAQLAPQWHCIGFECPGIFDDQTLTPSFEALALRYADEITAQPLTTPPLLLGWSMGGMLAWATARLLEERGHTVRLALLDTAVTPLRTKPEYSPPDFATVRAGGGAGAELAARLTAGLDAETCARLERGAMHNDALAAEFVIAGGIRSAVLCLEALCNEPATGMAAVAQLTSGTVQVIGLECGHFELLTPPWLATVAQHLVEWESTAR
jgi:amino acid adenylation domain-containing protein